MSGFISYKATIGRVDHWDKIAVVSDQLDVNRLQTHRIKLLRFGKKKPDGL